LDVTSDTPAEFCFKERFSTFFFLLAHFLALIGAKLMPHSSVISTIDTMALIVL